jgi:hypothetical protein
VDLQDGVGVDFEDDGNADRETIPYAREKLVMTMASISLRHMPRRCRIYPLSEKKKTLAYKN